MSEVIQLYEPVATCPKCGGQLWLLHLDGLHHNYENITAHECSSCGYKINFVVEEHEIQEGK